MAYALKRYQAQVVTGSGLDMVVATWLLFSPFFAGFGGIGAALTNNIICGAIALMTAIIRFMGAYRQVWLSWITCAVGIWVLISPWALGFAGNRAATVNNVIVGIVMAALACWSAIAHVVARRAHHGHTGRYR